MSGDVKLYGAKIQFGRREILLSKIFQTADLFDPSRNRRAVIGGYIKLFNGLNF